MASEPALAKCEAADSLHREERVGGARSAHQDLANDADGVRIDALAGAAVRARNRQAREAAGGERASARPSCTVERSVRLGRQRFDLRGQRARPALQLQIFGRVQRRSGGHGG